MKNKYSVNENIVEIEVTKLKNKQTEKHIVMIDLNSLQYLDNCSITVMEYKGTYYAKVYFNGETRLLHRYLISPDREDVVDHIDGNGLNNTLSNLRSASRSENAQNKLKPYTQNKSGILGVSFCNTTKKWQAQVQVNKTLHPLGKFKTIEEAAKVVKEFRKKNLPFSKEAREI